MNSGWKYFTFSEFHLNEYQKLDLIFKIQALNGIYFETEHLKSSSTHLIVAQPSLTPKYLTACAAGKWILKPQYIYDSFEAVTWLEESKYEWNAKSYIPNKNSSVKLYSAPKLCREKVHSQGAGIFKNWKVAILLLDNKKKKMYSRILKQGGAKIFKYKLPISSSDIIDNELTHVIIEKENEIYIKMFLEKNIVCITPEYIHNYLLTESKPNSQIFYMKNNELSIESFETYHINKLFIEEENSKKFKDKKLVPLIKKLKDSKHYNNYPNYHSLKNVKKSIFQKHHGSMKFFLKSKYFIKSMKNDPIHSHQINKPEICKTNYKNFKSMDVKNQKQTKLTSFLKYDKIFETEKLKIKEKNKFGNYAFSSKCFDHKKYNINNSISFNQIATKNSKSKIHKSIITSIEDFHSFSSSSSDFEDETFSLPHKKRKNFWKLYMKKAPDRIPLLYPYKIEKEINGETASKFQKGILQYFQAEKETSDLQTLSIFASSIKEEEYTEAIYFANCFLSSEKYPSYQILNAIMNEVLQKVENEHLANKVHLFLSDVLCLHPPNNINSRQYYMKALFYENENSPWNYLEKVICQSILITSKNFAEISQSIRNNQLLFTFILSVLEQDFENFLQSSPCPPVDIRMHSTCPMIVKVFWPRSEVGDINYNCNKLFSFLASLLSSRMCEKEKNVALLLLQRLITMVAECCQISQRNVTHEIIYYLGPKCDKYALSLIAACADAISTVNELKWFLTTLQPQWLKVKVCLFLLDDYFLMWGYQPGNDGISLSLRKIIRQYMFPVPASKLELEAYRSEISTKDIHVPSEDKKLLKQSKLSLLGIERINKENSKADKRVWQVNTTSAYSETEKKRETLENKNEESKNSQNSGEFAISNKMTLESKNQIQKFLLLLLNLLLAYIKMHHLNDIMKMLKEKTELQKQEFENINKLHNSIKRNNEKENFLQGHIPNILRTFLGQEPSINTVITICDDLYMALEFQNHQLNFEKYVKKICKEESNIPKDILFAIQLIKI